MMRTLKGIALTSLVSIPIILRPAILFAEESQKKQESSSEYVDDYLETKILCYEPGKEACYAFLGKPFKIDYNPIPALGNSNVNLKSLGIYNSKNSGIFYREDGIESSSKGQYNSNLGQFHLNEQFDFNKLQNIKLQSPFNNQDSSLWLQWGHGKCENLFE